MEPKYNEIEEKLSFPISGGSKEWKEPVTWRQLISTEGVKLDDILFDIQYVSQEGSGWGIDAEPATYYTATIFIKRKRLETPEEFLTRREKEEYEKNMAKEVRRRQYLSLKAEFDPTNVSS